MARFSLLLAAAGLVLLVAMAEAITSTRTEMPCTQQMVEQQMLNQCMMYLDTSIGMSSGRAGMPEASPEEYLEMCCKQLQNMDEMCRCEAIKMVMNQQGWITQQHIGRMMGMAQNLPSMCNLKPEMCQMQAVWF